MKTKLTLLLLACLLFVKCSFISGENDPTPEPEPDPDPAEGTTNGSTTAIKKFSAEWLSVNGGGGGFLDVESFKNFQLDYEVSSNNQQVRFDLSSSDLDVAFILYNQDGSRMWVSKTGRSVSEVKTLNAGKYRMSVMAERNGLGKFSLSISGINKDITRIPSEILHSGDKSWGDLGGGGPVITPKNHSYSFEVTENNTYVDIELSSKDTEVRLFIYDANNQLIGSSATNKRNQFDVLKFNNGVYYVMAATSNRGALGTYNLNLYGKTQNLKKAEAKEKIIEGNWTDSKDIKVFEFEVTENNSYLDVELSSPAYPVRLEVIDNKGANLAFSQNFNSVYRIVKVQKGLYKASVRPQSNSSLSGNFKLVVVGSIK